MEPPYTPIQEEVKRTFRSTTPHRAKVKCCIDHLRPPPKAVTRADESHGDSGTLTQAANSLRNISASMLPGAPLRTICLSPRSARCGLCLWPSRPFFRCCRSRAWPWRDAPPTIRSAPFVNANDRCRVRCGTAALRGLRLASVLLGGGRTRWFRRNEFRYTGVWINGLFLNLATLVRRRRPVLIRDFALLVDPLINFHGMS